MACPDIFTIFPKIPIVSMMSKGKYFTRRKPSGVIKED
jgi:hypothetical protein